MANSAFLLEGYLGARLDRSLSFVSELGAQGEPGAAFFRLSDVVAGALLFVGAVAAYSVLPRNPALRVGIVAAACFAALTFIDGFLPLDCAPTVDAACRAAEDAQTVSWQHSAHNLTGVAEGVLAPAALLLIGYGSWQLRRRGELPVEWESQWQVLTLIGVLYAVLSAAIALLYLAHIDGVGIWQRLQIVLYAAAMFTLGLVIWHLRDQPRKGST
ncbi:MAG: hypothetical protein QG597_794 [Actinomycetota bacterium]|nr:hypothetical protein [Actinomycetota bacterium]